MKKTFSRFRKIGLTPGIFFLLLFLLSCQSKKLESTADILEKISPDEQENTIDPTKENTIEGEKGTKIFIPANAFVSEGGSLVTGKVKIALKEFYSSSDIISNSLSTRSDGYLLETGGMVNITATADGKELSLHKSTSLVIAFPNRDSTKRMETFYGSKDTAGNPNWLPAFQRGEGDGSLEGLDSSILDASMVTNEISLCGYLLPGNENDKEVTGIRHSDGTLYKHIEKTFPLNDSSLSNALCRDRLRILVNCRISPEGKFFNAEIDSSSGVGPSRLFPGRKRLIEYIESLPALALDYQLPKDDGYHYHLQICCHARVNWEEYNRRFKEKYSQYRDKAVKDMGVEAVNYYFLSTSRLGWINCDRFLYDESEKIDFVVNTPHAGDGLAYIAFDSLNSIMKGEKNGAQYVFRNMPVNSRVRVIGINYKDGKPLMAKTSASISTKPFILSGYREFTLKELEEEINKK